MGLVCSAPDELSCLYISNRDVHGSECVWAIWRNLNTITPLDLSREQDMYGKVTRYQIGNEIWDLTSAKATEPLSKYKFKIGDTITFD